MKNRISVGRLRAREQVKVYGLAELEEKMKDLAPRVHQKIFKRAVRPSLEGMMAAAKINVMAVPVLHPEHKVRKAIAGKIQIRMKGAVGSRYKTIGSLAVFYGKSATGRAKRLNSDSLRATLAHLIEFGFNLTHYFGRFRPTLGLKVKKILPRPFMRPAFEDNKSAAEATFLREIHAAIEEEDVKG
jgi:HK97 gp10 family phage protein